MSGEIGNGPAAVQRPVVIVTGSTGLIGSRILADLAADHELVGLDQRAPSQPGPEDFITCDLTEESSVADAFRQIRERHGNKIASVIHLAAYYDFAGEPSELYETLTVDGTRRLLQQLKSFEVEQFVFSSTLLVMQPAEKGEELTEREPTQGTWDYPRSKLEAEEAIQQERGSIPGVILRIAGVYDEEGHSVPIGQQIRRIYEKQLESYFFPGDSETGQAFVHLDDLIACFRCTVERRRALGEYEVFLIAEPDVMTYAELQDAIGEELHGKEWPTIRIPKAVAKAGAWVQEKIAGEGEEAFIKPWMVDLADQHFPVDIKRARARLGWNPQHRLRETLPAILEELKRDPVAWYERHGYPTDEVM